MEKVRRRALKSEKMDMKNGIKMNNTLSGSVLLFINDFPSLTLDSLFNIFFGISSSCRNVEKIKIHSYLIKTARNSIKESKMKFPGGGSMGIKFKQLEFNLKFT